MTSETCPHCGFGLRHPRPDGRCANCGKEVLPETAPPPVPAIDALKQDGDAGQTEMEKKLRAFLCQKVAEGFDDEPAIIDHAVALFVKAEAHIPSYWDFNAESQYPEEQVRPAAERLTAELLDRHRRLETEWHGPTDCDRLDQVFEELDRQ